MYAVLCRNDSKCVWGIIRRRQFGFLESIFGAGLSPTLYRETDHSKYLPCYINRIIARCVCLCECKNVMNASEVKKQHGKFVSKQFSGHWGPFMWGLFVNTTTMWDVQARELNPSNHQNEKKNHPKDMLRWWQSTRENNTKNNVSEFMTTRKWRKNGKHEQVSTQKKWLSNN